MNAATYATTQHVTIQAATHFHEFVSSFIAPKHAKHGTYKSVNTMNDNDVSGVNKAGNIVPIPSSPTPKSVPNVDTTLSFASIPNTNATAACQFPNPSGWKIGAMKLPIIPIILLADASSTPSGRLLNIHIRIQVPKITVPAFLIKSDPLSYM